MGDFPERDFVGTGVLHCRSDPVSVQVSEISLLPSRDCDNLLFPSNMGESPKFSLAFQKSESSCQGSLMLQQLRDCIKASQGDPEEVFESFFDLYDKILFSKSSPIDGLAEFETPIKELVAAHQAWGMISSDGFKNYLSHLDERFDEQVRLGLCHLGKADCYRGLSEARILFRKNNGEIPEDAAHRLWILFYTPIEDLEIVIGKYLIEHYGK